MQIQCFERGMAILESTMKAGLLLSWAWFGLVVCNDYSEKCEKHVIEIMQSMKMKIKGSDSLKNA